MKVHYYFHYECFIFKRFYFFNLYITNQKLSNIYYYKITEHTEHTETIKNNFSIISVISL